MVVEAADGRAADDAGEATGFSSPGDVPGDRGPRPRGGSRERATSATARRGTKTGTAAPALNTDNIFFTAPGSPARYIGSQVVAIEAGNINFVGDCKKLPNGSGDRLKPGINDTIQPFADIYIVAGAPPSPDSDLVDSGGGAPNVVHGGLGGSFVYEPLGITKPAGQITSGTYGIVIDECQNKVFDAGEDTYIPNAFRVDTTTYVPGFSPEVQAFQKLKQSAARGATAIDSLEQILLLEQAYEVGSNAYSAITASFSVESAATFWLNETITAIADGTGYNIVKDRAKTIARATLAEHKDRLKNLAADPPDPNFSRFAVPAAAGAWFEESTTPMAEDFAAYTAEYDVLSALTGGILDALQRYQGAAASGDATWALRHPRTIESLSQLYGTRLASFNAKAAQLRSSVGPLFDRPYDMQNTVRGLNDALNSLRRPNLDTSFQLLNTGESADTAKKVLDHYDKVLSGPLLDTRAQWFAILDEASASVNDFAASLPDFANMAAGLESQLKTTVGADDTDPNTAITVTGTPSAGATVDLTLTGLNGAPASVQWDLNGDGKADDASGASTTWKVPGNAMEGAPLVASAVASGAGFQDSATTVVTVVAGGNRAPVLDGQNRTYREVAPGATTSFAVAATDPDGDPLTYEWLVDGVTQPGQTSPNFDLTFGPNEFGGRHVEVLVSDGSALSRWGWFAARRASGRRPRRLSGRAGTRLPGRRARQRRQPPIREPRPRRGAQQRGGRRLQPRHPRRRQRQRGLRLPLRRPRHRGG